jgi:hypothetical protein
MKNLFLHLSYLEIQLEKTKEELSKLLISMEKTALDIFEKLDYQRKGYIEIKDLLTFLNSNSFVEKNKQIIYEKVEVFFFSITKTNKITFKE